MFNILVKIYHVYWKERCVYMCAIYILFTYMYAYNYSLPTELRPPMVQARMVLILG